MYKLKILNFGVCTLIALCVCTCKIAKVDIEQYQCGKNVPGCTIELEWTGKGEPERLSHQVNIIGAKKPENYFHLRYCPQPIGELCVYAQTKDRILISSI